MNEFKELQKDLPQLIVALDSLDDDANYIHIKDAKEDTIYYCPCCKGTIKPRAYKEDKEYQVQAHFYHENGGCNEETFIHYICKMWLFESGCEFKVNNQIYTVSKIETEKIFHTKFGDYRPDITVYTEENKIFFFEIKNTNKKTENYIPKWDELENDVVEVDVRYFINQKVDSNIPEFKLIYSDGECFINTYTRKDYEETIALRKLEWKRQDKINYKIMWEKLDWFWVELQKYKNGESTSESLLETFDYLDFYDIEDCWHIINKMSCCKNIKDECRDIINNKSQEKFKELLQEIIDKFEGKLKFYDFCCEPRNDLYISYIIDEKYKLNSSSYSYGSNGFNRITCDNRTWFIPPSKVILLFNKFKEEKEELIMSHCKNVEILKNTFTWNNAPMFYDKNVFGSYINMNFNDYTDRNGYVYDSGKVINSINNDIVDKVSSFYEDKYLMGKSDIRNYIDSCLKEHKIINNLLESFVSYDGYSFYYKGNKVMYFRITSDLISYKNKELSYNFVKDIIIKEFLKECIDLGVSEINDCIPAIDIITDIKCYSNKTWDLNVDVESKSMIITLNYTVHYYDAYIKRVSKSKHVDISDMFETNFYFKNYHEGVNNFLDARVAPQMEHLVKEVLHEYNSNHINSVICRKSDIKSLTTKEECECQNN